MNAIMMLHRAQTGYLASQGSGSKYIKFADPAVEAVLMAKGVSSDGVGITTADAEAVTDIGTWFHGNTEITSFDEFEKFTGVKTIVWDAFAACSNMTSMVLPKSITSLQGRCFNGMPKLMMDIDLPNLTSIDQYSPFVNTGLRRIYNLGKITTMKSWHGTQFYFVNNAPNLDLVIIPSSVATIQQYPFRDCPSLTTLVVKNTTPPSLAGAIKYGTTPIPTIYVPDSSVTAYQDATNWSSYASSIMPISQLATDNPTLYAEIEEYL